MISEFLSYGLDKQVLVMNRPAFAYAAIAALALAIAASAVGRDFKELRLGVDYVPGGGVTFSSLV